MSSDGPIPGWGSLPGTGGTAVDPPAIPDRLADIWRTYRDRRREIVWLALAIQGPLGLLHLPLSIFAAMKVEELWQTFPAIGASDPAAFETMFRRFLPGSDPLALAAAVLAPSAALLAGLLLTGAISALLLVPHGEERSVRGSLTAVLRRAAPIAVPVVLAAAVFGVLTMMTSALLASIDVFPGSSGRSFEDASSSMSRIFLFDLVVLIAAVTGSYAAVRWALAMPALIIEGIGLRAALRRSGELTHGRRITVLLTLAVVTIVSGIVDSLATYVPTLLIGGGSDVDARFVVSLVIALAGSVIVAPLAPFAIVFLYRDFVAGGPRGIDPN